MTKTRDLADLGGGFTQAGTGAKQRTVESKLQDVVSVLDFIPESEHAAIKSGTSTYDATAAIQAAVAGAISIKKAIFFPAGTYLVTDTINLPEFTQIYGENLHTAARGYGADPVASTKISFQPTTAKPLFVCSGTPFAGPYRRGYRIEGLFIHGNSTNASGNSTIAIDVDSTTDSTFAHLAIQGFRTGIRAYFTINNKFDRVRVINCYEQCVLYDGGAATTDLWHQCYISNALIGVKATGSSVAIRFVSCIFESITNYGAELDKQVYGWEFIDTYVEDVPSAAGLNTSGSMFRVGLTGTTLTEATQLTVIGGIIGGPNGAVFGAAFDVGEVSGVIVSGPTISRYTNAIKTDAATRVNSIISHGFSYTSVTTSVSDVTKVTGILPLFSSNNLAGYNQQYARLGEVITTGIYSSAGSVSMQGTHVTLGSSTASYVYPIADNVTTLGLSGQRWSTIYAATATINTSDGREKQDISNLDDAEQRVAATLKGLNKKFRFKDAVQAKGDGARIHVGVITQEVITAFEAEGLDPMRYGIVCYDEWDAKSDEDGNEIVSAGNCYGIRYEELLAFIIAAL